ncbi:MAG: phospholipid carrier-dependent glycosyltransferase [Candidatus Yanofskybacteria bacterium]|nr:phospholipid carrier-dependent glycosyltransferase [Candidatus Yanofskybacteria bacterium]
MNKKAIFGLLVLSLLTHFLFFGHPNQTVFDEVHFGKFISGYYTGEYYFDIHPPLGKLIIAGFAKLFHFQPEFSFAEIGEKFPDKKYEALRFLPSLAGTLLPLVIFALALELGLKRRTAFMAGLFIVLENALLVQSRFILLDSFLLLFGFSTLWFYLRYRHGKGLYNLFLMGILGSFAMSVKWTGASFLALTGVIELLTMIKTRQWQGMVPKVASFIVIPFVIYFSVFAIHFKLLPKTGTGDAFMTPEFQKTLIGNGYQDRTDLKTPNVFDKFIELNAEMYRSNQRLTATHPYGSKWYEWPFMTRPIYYWTDDHERIYLLGNPILWWLSTVAVLTDLFARKPHLVVAFHGGSAVLDYWIVYPPLSA